MKRFKLNILGEKDDSIDPKTIGKYISQEKKMHKLKNARSKKYVSIFKGSGKQYSYTDKRDLRQNVVCKSSIGKTKKLHKKNLDYIKAEGKGKEGNKAELYGYDPEGYIKRMKAMNFRIILSPENQEVDLPTLTKEFIRKIELAAGLKLDWVAADHYDKPHQHTHILINGIDLNGKRVRFDNDLLKTEMRNIARTISTQLVGERTIEEINESILKSVKANRACKFDELLKSIHLQTGSISKAALDTMRNGTLLHKRLLHLIDIGLCTYTQSGKAFNLIPLWDDHLKANGKYGSYFDAFISTRAELSQYSTHDPKVKGMIQGKVLQRYFMQDNSNTHAVVLKTDDNRIVYVPLPAAPRNIQPGDMVRVNSEQNIETGKPFISINPYTR